MFLKTNQNVATYATNRFTWKSFPVIAIVDAGTIGIGLAVGFFALLNQAEVTGLR
jgi:hypothetical protein